MEDGRSPPAPVVGFPQSLLGRAHRPQSPKVEGMTEKLEKVPYGRRGKRRRRKRRSNTSWNVRRVVVARLLLQLLFIVVLVGTVILVLLLMLLSLSFSSLSKI